MKIQRWNKVIAIFLVFLLLGNLIPQSVSASGNDSNVTELTESMEDSEPSDYEDVSNELQNDNDTEATILCELVEKREENVKHFLMSNNAIQAVMYSEPVHYKEGGEWKNIDNTLTLENALEKEDFKGYKNKNNSFSVKIASEVQDSNLVSIKKDKYKLSFNLISDKKSNKVVGKKKNTKDKGVDKESKLIEDINTESDQIIFYNIKDSVDIEYQVTSKGVKENIIINERQSQYEYIYNITTQNLELKLKGNEILAYAEDTQELIYKIPAPFMYDSNNNFSTDVIYNLTKSQKGYIFEIVPNSDWLNDVDRAFPVVIDPIITTETKKSTIDSTFISSSKATTNFYEYLMLLIGVETSAYGKCRTLLKFDLPELNPGDIIVNARLNLLQYQISSYSASNPDMPINAYMVTSDWTASGVSWSTMPSYSSTILDFSYMSRNDAVCWKGFDITKAVKAWYDGGSGNNGIMLAANQESGANSEVAMVARYWSEKYNQETDAYPLIYLEYRNTKGIEDYYSYSEINAGDLGDLFINNYTGNMTLLESGVSTSGQRAPANVSVVYNTTSSDKVLKNTMPYCGYGWKLNIQQFVKKSTEYGLTGTAATNYPYVYIDEDGTEHYFMKVIKDSKTLYYDEDGLGLELTINSSSTNEYYVITDAKDGKMNFDKNGNLQTIIDANNNKITINYNSAGTAIESITDGAGKIIKIGRTSDGYLSTIIDPANRATAYTISSNKLVKITYPDNTYSTISYDSNIQNIIISSVVCPNKLRYDFKYSSAKEGKRVVFINEYSVKDSATTAAGQIMLFDYSKYNTTIKRTAGIDSIFGSSDDIYTNFQFDNFGRLVSTQSKSNGKQLVASTASYTSGAPNSAASNIKYLNRISKSATLGANVNNILKNHNVEKSGSWRQYASGNTTFGSGTGYTSAYSYYGNKSLCLTVANATAGSFVRYYQPLSTTEVIPGKTYTFSSHIKTTGLSTLKENTYGATLAVLCSLSDGTTKSFYSDYITKSTDTSINNGWRRESVTFQVPTNTIETLVCIILKDANGNAYFDGLQLEEGTVANKYNFLENSSFEDETTLYGYTTVNLTLNSNNDTATTSSKLQGNVAFKIKGDSSKQKWIEQGVAISGSEEDTYIISGWAKADAVKQSFADESSNKVRRFTISVKVTYSDGTYVWKNAAEYSPAVSDWQYASVVINLSDNDSTTIKTPTMITISPRYDYQANSVTFDNLSVVKDEVPSYTYDSNGNLVSVVKNAEQKSTMQYSNNNLVSSKSPSGYDYTYTYDSKHNMTQANSQRGVMYNYTYNSQGNPTKLLIQNMSSSSLDMKIVTEMEYTSDGAYVSAVKDQDGYKTTYVYDSDKGVLNSTTNANGVITTNTYNDTNDFLTKVSSTIDNKEIATSFTYSLGYLASILHNGFQYKFEYDSFGNLATTKVGTQEIVSNTYKTNNGDLVKSTYGNGNYNNYAYDVFGNVTAVGVNGTTRYKWLADDTGQIVNHEDLKNQLLYNYDYDSTGRMIRWTALNTALSSSSQRNVFSMEYGYDLENNVTKLVNKAGVRTIFNYYSYMKDELLSSYTMASGKKASYTYDSLNRLNKIEIDTTNPIVVNYNYKLSERNATGEDLYRTTKLIKETVGDIAYSYEYDKLGNITKVYHQELNGSKVLLYSYQYDQLNQLVRENDKDKNISKVYTYDNGGNITKVTEYPYSTEILGTATKTISYTYGDSNWKDKLTAYDGSSITYDAIGNPLTYRGYNMTWSNGRELTTLTGNGVTASYTYSADGVRASKTVNGVKTEYEYVDGVLYYEKRGNIELHYQYDSYGSLRSIQYVTSTGSVLTYYVMTNSNGDVTNLYDSNGTEIARYSYDAWGNVTAIKSPAGNDITDVNHIANINPIRYRGYYYDAETGLYYLNSRYYDSEVKRFINADDIGVIDGGNEHLLENNLFSYCFNNPVNYCDNNGAWPSWTKVLAVVAVVVVAVCVAPVVAPVVAAVVPTALAVVGGSTITTTVSTVVTAAAITGASLAIGTGVVGGAYMAATVSERQFSNSKKKVKSTYDPDPYRRPGQKRRGLETKGKNRLKKNYKPMNNQRDGKPNAPVSHHPSKVHKKYKKEK